MMIKSNYLTFVRVSRVKSFEQLEELWFGDFSIVVLINHSDELFDLILGNLSCMPLIFPTLGVVDQLSDLVEFESSTVILVVGVEDCIDAFSEIVVRVVHHVNGKFI